MNAVTAVLLFYLHKCRNCSAKFVLCIVECVREDEEFSKRRFELVEAVSDYDSELATKIIETESVESVTDKELGEAIKRITLGNQVVPVLMGSSFKYIGVQPLLDAISA